MIYQIVLSESRYLTWHNVWGQYVISHMLQSSLLKLWASLSDFMFDWFYFHISTSLPVFCSTLWVIPQFTQLNINPIRKLNMCLFFLCFDCCLSHGKLTVMSVKICHKCCHKTMQDQFLQNNKIPKEDCICKQW